MIAEQMSTERAKNFKSIERWSVYLEELHARIAHRFLRAEVRQRAYRYLTGLLADVRRKNSWQMAEAIGEARPRGVQHLLNDARWDPDAVRDDTSVSTSWNTSKMREAGYSSSMRPAS
jgi:SRSO17 transposase